MIGFKYILSIKKDGYQIILTPPITKYKSFDDYKFTFLNQSIIFPENNIDWDNREFGKLWTYNLNYFDFLLQHGMKPETGLALIEDFISKLRNDFTALEPYPIALHGINWIKFLSYNSEEDNIGRCNLSEINASLYAQYRILLDNLEYHLLGNHILEDGFSLLFGSFYFNDDEFYTKAIEILNSELPEQILEDGGHFELSPMYHQIILDRLFDCVNLVQNNKRFKGQELLLTLMKDTAIKMLKWINCMTFSNGDIPLLNDSASGIAPSTEQLNKYAIRLGVCSKETILEFSSNPYNLDQSGYRRFNGANYECIIDIGKIGSSYQPGHAHADALNFVLNINNQPLIVDTGISTYESNQTRLKERGTSAHNTVTINNQNSSDVWSSFRVARRSDVKVISEEKGNIIAKHNGYSRLNSEHQRKWSFQNEKIVITDTILGHSKRGKANFLLVPQNYTLINSNQIRLNECEITFENAREFKIEEQIIPSGFNQFTRIFKIETIFENNLVTSIQIKTVKN